MCIYSSSLNRLLLRPTLVSLITYADHSTGTVSVATAEPRTGLANVNMINSPAVPLSSPLLLDPPELGRPKANHTKTKQILKGLNCWKQQQRRFTWICTNVKSHVPAIRIRVLVPGGDVVWQLDSDPGPCRAIDWTVDCGLMELERRATHVVDRGGETL